MHSSLFIKIRVLENGSSTTYETETYVDEYTLQDHINKFSQMLYRAGFLKQDEELCLKNTNEKIE